MSRSILLINADLPLNNALCADLLLINEHREHVAKVYATVKSIEHAGAIAMTGAELIEMQDIPNEAELMELLKQVDVVCLTPDWTSDKMVRQSEIVIKTCRSANVKQLIVVSRVGIEDAPGNKTAERYNQIERFCHESKLKDVLIVRLTPCHQDLFAFRQQLQQGKLQWSMKPDALFTLVNFIDVVKLMRCEIVGQRRSSGQVEILKLTGQTLLSGSKLAQLITEQTKLQVKFEQVDKKTVERYCRDHLHWSQPMIMGVLDTFELIESGKLNFKSDDLSKTIGKKPTTIEQFLKDNASQINQRER